MSENTPQSGRTRNEAEAHDGERIQFLTTVPGHNAGDVAIVSEQSALAYINAGQAELLDME